MGISQQVTWNGILAKSELKKNGRRFLELLMRFGIKRGLFSRAEKATQLVLLCDMPPL